MADDELRRKLEDLRQQIERTGQTDDKGRTLLRDVDDQVRELLARSEEAEIRPRPALTRSLENAIRHFEVTHPALTAALSDLLSALSNAGI